MESGSLYSRYQGRYVKSDVKTASGKRKSLDKGDRLAQLLRGKSVEELTLIAQEHGIQADRWNHLNPGRFRMQVGRALRMLIKKGINLTIGGVAVDKL